MVAASTTEGGVCRPGSPHVVQRAQGSGDSSRARLPAPEPALTQTPVGKLSCSQEPRGATKLSCLQSSLWLSPLLQVSDVSCRQLPLSEAGKELLPLIGGFL